MSFLEQSIDLLKRNLEATTHLPTLIEQFLSHAGDSLGYSKDTMKPLSSRLRKFSEFCTTAGITDLDQLNNIVVSTYFAEYGKVHSKSTTNQVKRNVRLFLNWLIEFKEYSITANPNTIRVTKDKRKDPKSIDREIIIRVVQQAKNRQDSLMIALMYEGGLRIGELVRLKVADIDNDSVHINGKGEKERNVYITDVLAGELSAFITKRHLQPIEYLFQNDVYTSYGNQLTIGTARKRIQRCFARVADMPMVPHQLRHSYAIGLLQNGCDLVTIQKLLGHESIETTMIYLNISDKYKKDTYKKYIGGSVFA